MGQSWCKEYKCEEFILISIPENRLNSSLAAFVKAGSISSANVFILPLFKVGTLDSLFCVLEDLISLEKFADSLLKNMIKCESQFEKLQLQNALEMKHIVMNFNWDNAKYSNKLRIKEIADIIQKQLNKAEADMKKQGVAHQEVQSVLKQFGPKQNDTLEKKDFDEILNPEDFYLDSEHFKIVPVLVPHELKDEFLHKYTTFAQMVVPDSAVILMEDNKYYIYKVVIFKTCFEEFKTKATEHKFVVREFDPSAKSVKQKLYKSAIRDNARIQRQFINWLVINFKETFSAYLHIKALRVFVESVLRYGLPLNFKAIVIEPKKGAEIKVKGLLNRIFADLESNDGPIENHGDAGIMSMIKTHNLDEYYKYVFMKIQTNFRK